MDKGYFKLIGYLSRSTFLLMMFLIIIGVIMSVELLAFLGLLFMCVVYLAPGIFLLFRAPHLAQAWLSGINRLWVPVEHWDTLSSTQKLLIYSYSIFFFVITIIVLVIKLT